jgi:hypothetical protein
VYAIGICGLKLLTPADFIKSAEWSHLGCMLSSGKDFSIGAIYAAVRMRKQTSFMALDEAIDFLKGLK